MPYISPYKRRILQVEKPVECGELNYELTRLLTAYIETRGLTYQVINDIVGALEGAKLEFYRRIAVPYEDSKIQENGDVYIPVEEWNAVKSLLKETNA